MKKNWIEPQRPVGTSSMPIDIQGATKGEREKGSPFLTNENLLSIYNVSCTALHRWEKPPSREGKGFTQLSSEGFGSKHLAQGSVRGSLRSMAPKENGGPRSH